MSLNQTLKTNDPLCKRYQSPYDIERLLLANQRLIDGLNDWTIDVQLLRQSCLARQLTQTEKSLLCICQRASSLTAAGVVATPSAISTDVALMSASVSPLPIRTPTVRFLDNAP